ncbi:hypothetical protein MHJ94_11715 [Chryseobacterium taklimakanense]|uniref:hypothetical protein n=1 Tax=Chryseobacterium taklimakanense TaxID=536441 RepID=UPI001EF5B99E|nr:hypothetical protein [Chryseobacterium taklimakanense]MCG7281958.1 hypothetical protein [Chryseobacterium taklimakanense]
MEIGIFIIIIIAACVLVYSMRKAKIQPVKFDSEQPKTNLLKQNDKLPYQNKLHESNYFPADVQRRGLQVLETMHIMGTTKSFDTLKGRFEFLSEIIPSLSSVRSNSRYHSDIQSSIDRYKLTFYDRIIKENEMSAVLYPENFDLLDYYAESLVESFKKFYEDQKEEIKFLKREDSKNRRREKINQVLDLTKNELVAKCHSCSRFRDFQQLLENFDEDSNNKLTFRNEFPTNEKQIENLFQSKSNIKGQTFVIDKNAKFKLTLIGADKNLGEEIRRILLNKEIYSEEKKQLITPLFAEYNLSVKEVEDYKEKYGKIYFESIEASKRSSSEWETSGELDRKDLMEDFRKIAVKAIFERASCDLPVLFEKEPTNITIDDELIKRYGYKNLQTYIRFAGNMDKIRVITNDNYNRKKFESLVENGLAIRGSQITLAEILSTLTLKELNNIAGNIEKPFTRKKMAIEYVSSMPGIEEEIGSKISLRELFQLKPLPPEFSHIKISEIADAWNYTYQVVSLLVDTYIFSTFVPDLSDGKFVTGYEIVNYSKDEDMCPCAKQLISVKYPKSKSPMIPYHIGCNCRIREEFNFIVDL